MMHASLENVCALLMEWREGEPSAALETITSITIRSMRRRMTYPGAMGRAELRVMTALARVLHDVLCERKAGDAVVLLAWTTANLGSELQREAAA